MSYIEFNNVVKEYKMGEISIKALDNTNFQIEKGELVVIVGPSGAGKTTTFYMVVGLVKPNSGSITLDGQEISTWPMHMRARAGIGYLPQEASSFRRR